MKNNDDISTTDTTEIKQLIDRIKQGKLDQGDAQLIEKLLNFLLTIVSLIRRKHTSILQMKELLFGIKEKNRELSVSRQICLNYKPYQLAKGLRLIGLRPARKNSIYLRTP